MTWAEHVARICEKRNVYSLLVGEPEGKRPLGRQRRSWMHNIKMDLREIGCGGMDWMDLAYNREKWRALVSAVMKLRVYKILRSHRLAAQLVAFRVLSFTELVNLHCVC
jgi:hypothetical protein